jgi:hypothetical protein
VDKKSKKKWKKRRKCLYCLCFQSQITFHYGDLTMIKPYAVHIDRGFYGGGVFIPPIHLVFETEAEARAEYAKQLEFHKAEMAKTPGRPICDIQLIDMTNNKKVLLRDSFDKTGEIDLTPKVAGNCGWAREMDEALKNNSRQWGNAGVCRASAPWKKR